MFQRPLIFCAFDYSQIEQAQPPRVGLSSGVIGRGQLEVRVQARIFSLELTETLVRASQSRHFRPQPMQLGHLVAQALGFVRGGSEARQLLVFGSEPFNLLRLFQEGLILRAQLCKGSLLNHDRSSGSDNDCSAEEPCFQFGHAHKIQEAEG